MYYVRVKTRSAGASAKGTPRQAIAYITDGHDSRRDPGYSDAELSYIARMGDGWKTDLEGGRVPLVGFGALEGLPDGGELAARFDDSCVARHDGRATTGYKSFTFTLPKEVSLFAEGNRSEATAAIHAAVGSALRAVYGDKEYSAVAAVHTRNENGEIHYHAHVLVSKFAREKDTGRTVSLNSKRGGNTGHAQLRVLKEAWKDGVNREFRERLGLTVEQPKDSGPVALVLPDGTRLDPLNRNGRRVLEKVIAARFTVAQPSGAVVQRVLKFQVMDERIFEVAVGNKGLSGWDAQAFRELFADQTRYLDRHEKRVATLKAAGYLTAEGKITPEFRVHYALRQGILTPELQRIRIELARKTTREKPESGQPKGARRSARQPDFWTSLLRYDALRRRVERLGYSREEVTRIYQIADQLKPTPERLRELRAQRPLPEIRRAPTSLPSPLLRAFVAPATRSRGLLMASARPIGNQDPTSERTVEDDVRKFAETFLIVGSSKAPGWSRALALDVRRIYARQVELRRPDRGVDPTPRFRPIFAASLVALPRASKQIEPAIARCADLARSTEIQSINRQEIGRAYKEWRQAFIERPLAELRRHAAALELPVQEKGRAAVDAAREKLAPGDLAHATALFRNGLRVLATARPAEAARLAAWSGRDEDLVREILKAAKGEAAELPRDEYQVALKAGRIGHLLDVEGRAPVPAVPAALADESGDIERLSARLHAFGVKNPLGRDALAALAPAEIRSALEGFRKEGLLAISEDWTLHGATARRLAEELRPRVERAIEEDRHLTDRLLAGRSSPS